MKQFLGDGGMGAARHGLGRGGHGGGWQLALTGADATTAHAVVGGHFRQTPDGAASGVI